MVAAMTNDEELLWPEPRAVDQIFKHGRRPRDGKLMTGGPGRALRRFVVEMPFEADVLLRIEPFEFHHDAIDQLNCVASQSCIIWIKQFVARKFDSHQVTIRTSFDASQTKVRELARGRYSVRVDSTRHSLGRRWPAHRCRRNQSRRRCFDCASAD